MTSLLPPNATTTERALETATARIGGIPIIIGDLWNPNTCTVDLLPWLAWALAVDEWDSSWTAETQRAAIAVSVAVHRHKGTRAALRAAIDAAGYGDAEIVERFGYRFYDGTRRHNAGNDNYAAFADDMTDAIAWPAGQTINGITVTKIAVGTGDDGLRFADYSVAGTASPATSGVQLYNSALSRAPAAAGQTWTVSVIAQIIAGTAPTASGTGVRLEIAGETTAPSFLQNVASISHRPTSETVVSHSGTLTVAGVQQARCGLALRTDVGVTVDYTVRVKGLQFETGPVRTEIEPYNFDHSAPDHWAEYRLNLARPITIAQAAQVRRIAEGVAPVRSRLKLLTYTAAQHSYSATILNDGTFAHGAA